MQNATFMQALEFQASLSEQVNSAPAAGATWGYLNCSLVC